MGVVVCPDCFDCSPLADSTWARAQFSRLTSCLDVLLGEMLVQIFNWVIYLWHFKRPSYVRDVLCKHFSPCVWPPFICFAASSCEQMFWFVMKSNLSADSFHGLLVSASQPVPLWVADPPRFLAAGAPWPQVDRHIKQKLKSNIYWFIILIVIKFVFNLVLWCAHDFTIY